MARGALDVLRQRHIRVLGLIFNAAVSSPYGRNYYERYQQAYGWQPKEDGFATALTRDSAPNGKAGRSCESA